jgi:hypothetical protein
MFCETRVYFSKRTSGTELFPDELIHADNLEDHSTVRFIYVSGLQVAYVDVDRRNAGFSIYAGRSAYDGYHVRHGYGSANLDFSIVRGFPIHLGPLAESQVLQLQLGFEICLLMEPRVREIEIRKQRPK